MGGQGYRDVLGMPVVRRALALGLLIRIPMWAAGIVLTLHVVGHLGRSYTAAGLVVAVATVAAAVSGPWRGRMLDRRGLRATVLPSLLVLTACWSVAPFVGYWLLVPLAGLAGLFVVPTFSIIRQVLIGAVDDRRRTTALVLDSVAVEISFMAGPALGVLLATAVDTPIALLVCEFASILGGLALWILDPPLPVVAPTAVTASGPNALAGSGPAAVTESESQSASQLESPSESLSESGSGSEQKLAPPGASRAGGPLSSWMTPTVLAVLAASTTATVVLTGTDVSVVAGLRDWGHQTSIGWILAIWGAGSAIGGLAYGALGRTISPFLLVGALGASTAAVAFAQDRLSISILLFVAGVFCAPTITATIDTLSRVVPPGVRGEAMGWHGSAMTIGSAVGAPAIGAVLDRGSWHGGFVAAGVIGVLIGAAGWATISLRRARRGAELSVQAGAPPSS